MSVESVERTSRSEEEREQLILDHVPLLRHIVGRLFFDVPGALERDDLFGFGMLGLIGAADTWDESRALAFSTFAYPRIRGAILDELRRMDFLPRGRRERVREVESAIERLEQELGRKPSPEQVAEAVGLTAAEIDEVLVTASTAIRASLDAGSDESIGAELRNLLSDPESVDPVGSAEFDEMKEQLIHAITELPEQEKTVITLYYAEDLYLREIADILGVTESRVSQIHSRAIYRLNQTMDAPTRA